MAEYNQNEHLLAFQISEEECNAALAKENAWHIQRSSCLSIKALEKRMLGRFKGAPACSLDCDSKATCIAAVAAAAGTLWEPIKNVLAEFVR